MLCRNRKGNTDGGGKGNEGMIEATTKTKEITNVTGTEAEREIPTEEKIDDAETHRDYE